LLDRDCHLSHKGCIIHVIIPDEKLPMSPLLGHAKEINIRDGLQATAENHQNLYTYFSAVALQ
jgi:hypothetical protein